MKGKVTKEAIRLTDEVLKELDSTKGSLQVAIQKLSRVAILIDDTDLKIWCEIQLGNTMFTAPIIEYLDAILNDTKLGTDDAKKKLNKLNEIGIKEEIHLNKEEILSKYAKSGGGYSNIGFVENIYADFVKNKKGNDGTYYKNNLLKHLSFVKKSAHDRVTKLYKDLSFSDVPQSVFDTIKTEVEDKLLDLDADLAEMLMISFQNVSSNNNEEWSQAFVTCRRFLECLADRLYPPKEDKQNGRALGQSQYLNRIWAFMDDNIKSSSNKELAKIHVDLLGSYMQNLYKLYNKGVHSEVTKLEAIKVVFHTYLLIADLLGHLNEESNKQIDKLDLNLLSLDEIESLLDVNRSVAKEIVKFRITNGHIDIADLGGIKGIGPKTLKKVQGLLKED